MGRAEMIILIGAIAILGRYSLTVNDALAGNEIHILQSEYELNAVSIVEGVFRQAWLKSFDENTVTGNPDSIPGSFTGASALGTESGESYPNFDDIDDFNDLTIEGEATNGMTYSMKISVGYVDVSDKETFLATRSSLKRMNVTLSSDYMRNDITFSRIYPYWK
ncbi:MAG: hypothetical protein K9N35_00980 [Candidatus Marinimicrobia bacterium]|nr:hypothetical protein [Candidatus Neomarinimicrobiota bacterium]